MADAIIFFYKTMSNDRYVAGDSNDLWQWDMSHAPIVLPNQITRLCPLNQVRLSHYDNSIIAANTENNEFSLMIQVFSYNILLQYLCCYVLVCIIFADIHYVLMYTYIYYIYV